MWIEPLHPGPLVMFLSFVQLPRTYVNVVEILDVTKLGKLKTGLFCDIIHL